jgi:hypothetical protein
VSIDYTAELARLDPYLDVNVLKPIGEYGMAPPDVTKAWLAVLDRSALYLYTQGDRATPAAQATLDKINKPINGKETHNDVGTIMPNGPYVLTSQPLGGSTTYPLAYIEGARENARFLFVPEEITFGALINDTSVSDAMKQRGMLLYNATSRPTPLFGFLSYKPDRRDTYYWQFIDKIVEAAMNQLFESERRLGELQTEVQKRPFTATVSKMFAELRSKATLYKALDLLHDNLKVLSYLRYLKFLPGFDTARLFGADKIAEARFATLVDEYIPALEQKLVDAGNPLTIDDLIAKVDKKLAELRSKAPLLGRLQWWEIELFPDEVLAGRVLGLLGYLKGQNATAQEMTNNDMARIRKLGKTIPPRVMGIPRIVHQVEQQEMSKINSDIDYFFAVMHIKEQAETFGLMLGLAQLVFSFFCPPVGIALGFMQAAMSIDSAVYKTALSDADYDVDRTMISQAEAEEARFWALVDTIFAFVDLNEFTKAMQESREVAKLAKLDQLAHAGEDVKNLAKDAKAIRGADELATVAEDAKALEKATEPLDVAAARREAGKAKKGTVSLEAEHRPRIEEPPATAAEAMEQARKADAEISKRFEGAIELPNGEEIPVKTIIDEDYKQYYKQAMLEREEALAKGLPAVNPEGYNEYGLRRYAELVAQKAEGLKLPTRMQMLEDMAKAENKTLKQLLEDGDALRDALVKRINGKRMQLTTDGIDGALRKVRKAVQRGKSSAQIDKVIAEELIKPIDALAKKAGYAAGEGRDFGFFAKGIKNAEKWTDPEAMTSLRRLFEDAAVDNSLVHAAMNNKAYLSKLKGEKTVFLNEQVAKALDKIRDVEGVLKPTSFSNNSLLRTIATANHRGSAFEAILVSRLVEPARLAGAKIVTGRRWWLEAIEDFNKAGGRVHMNVLEADILVLFPNGRRVLIDAKFFENGLRVEEGLATQLTKQAAAIDEGIIHNSEYWVSHRFALESSKAEAAAKAAKAKAAGIPFVEQRVLSDYDFFQSHADMLSSGRIHIQQNVMEKGFPANFFEESHFLEVSRGDAIIIPPDSLLGIPATGPKALAVGSDVAPLAGDVGSVVTDVADSFVPVAERVETIVPEVTHAQEIVTETRAAEHYANTVIPINPLRTAARIVVRAARKDDPLKTPVSAFQLVRVFPDSTIGKVLARSFTAQQIDYATMLGVVDDVLVRQRTCYFSAAPTMERKFNCWSTSIPLRDSSGAMYALLVARGADEQGEISARVVLHDEVGRTVWVGPGTPDPVRIPRDRVTVIPFTLQSDESPYGYLADPGVHQWGLRLIAPSGDTRVFPATLTMRVQEH